MDVHGPKTKKSRSDKVKDIIYPCLSLPKQLIINTIIYPCLANFFLNVNQALVCQIVVKSTPSLNLKVWIRH